jgi:hypothetical protein
MAIDLHSVTFDCARPLALARFWAAALGWEVPPYGEKELAWLRDRGVADVEDDPAVVVNPPGGGARLLFLQVPEGKSVKNRIHLDVRATTTMREEVERLAGLGATVDRMVEEELGCWTVMRDPEGNEFCVERSEAERTAG